MSLDDFFRINMPYFMVRIKNDEWVFYNREGLPLGWNDIYKKEHHKEDDAYANVPIRTKYVDITEEFLNLLVDDEKYVSYDEDGKIKEIQLHSGGPGLKDNDEFFESYFRKIILLSRLKRTRF